MPDATRAPVARRLLAATLYLGCVAAAGAAVYPLVAHEPPRAVAPEATPEDDLPFDPVPLPPGHWVLVAPAPQNGDPGREQARQALGVATAADLDPAAVPVPTGVRVSAVRVDLNGRPCGALTGPTDLSAARAAWVAAGWKVADHDFGRELRAVRLTRGTSEATAWVMPRGPLVQLLVTAAPPAADPHGGPNP